MSASSFRAGYRLFVQWKTILALTSGCALVVACGSRQPSSEEIARMNDDARFAYSDNATAWLLDDTPPTKVSDPRHFRSLLADPAPKSLVITDGVWSRKEHAVLCAAIVPKDIRVTRLAIKVTHISRPMSDAIACLARLPLEYLTFYAYPNNDGALDPASLIDETRLRGLALVGHEIGKTRAFRSERLEELHLVAMNHTSGPDWSANRKAFFNVVANLPLRSLSVTSEAGRWSMDHLSPLVRLSSLTDLHLQLRIQPDSLRQLVSSFPTLKRVALIGGVDDSVAEALVAIRLESLSVSGGAMTDKGLESISRIATLERFSIFGEGFTDAGVEHLAELGELRHLSLQFLSNVKGTSVKAIARLEKLESLKLAGTPIEHSRLHHLAALGALKVLTIGPKGPLPCVSLSFLETLSELEELEIWNAEPECLGRLRQLGKLRSLLYLGRAATRDRHSAFATGAQVRAIVALPITELALGAIDDSAAKKLGEMNSLRSLSVVSTKLSGRGVSDLMGSRSLRRLSLGRGRDDDHSWLIWTATRRARCGRQDLEVFYCPAPYRSMPCGLPASAFSSPCRR